MKFRIIRWRAAIGLAALALLFGVPAAAAPSAAAASTGVVRIGNLSEPPTPVDVYLYSSGDSSPQFVQQGVAYGQILPYQSVNSGSYSVKMRTAGSSATSSPVWSVNFTVQPGGAYTVVPLRTSSQQGQLQVIDDNLTTPTGKSFVRVIQADIDQKAVTFHCSCGPGAKGDIMTSGAPGTVTGQAPIPPGPWTMTATGSTAKTSQYVPLTAGTVRTEVVIAGPNNTVEIENVLDAAGAGEFPNGGVGTGFGGTAPHGPGSPLPWLAVIGAGALLAMTAAGAGLRRRRLGRLTARG